MKKQTSYSMQSQEICDLFADYVEGDATRPFLVVSSRGVSDEAAAAIGKSLDAFGYQAPAWSQAQLAPAHIDCPLDENAVLLLIEGIDPLRIICTDAAAMELLAQAYRVQLSPNSVGRLWGRTSAIFADFNALISSDAGKRSAWQLLKSLK